MSYGSVPGGRENQKILDIHPPAVYYLHVGGRSGNSNADANQARNGPQTEETKMTTMQIRLKNENCVRAGAECHCDPDAQCGDCTAWEVSAESARDHLAQAYAIRGSTYHLRIAYQIAGNLEAADAEGLPAVTWSVREGRYVSAD